MKDEAGDRVTAGIKIEVSPILDIAPATHHNRASFVPEACADDPGP